jgi:mannose-6-phosphate isomerase-like protein (cupin superfamily)
LAKVKDEFIWHKHEETDETFFVIKGQLTILLRDQDIVINEGEIVVIPKGVEHKPIADKECQIMLIEPKETVNTGNIANEMTVKNNQWI